MEPCLVGALQGVEGLGGGMAAAYEAQHLVVEALYADAQAVEKAQFLEAQ